MNYSKFVASLCKSGEKILNELKPSDCHLLHMCMGLSGETGELIDAIKKSIMYRKPLDLDHVIEELGDIYFYLEGILNQLGVTREEVLERNMTKLGARYSEGSYSDQAAVERKDKG